MGGLGAGSPPTSCASPTAYSWNIGTCCRTKRPVKNRRAGCPCSGTDFPSDGRGQAKTLEDFTGRPISYLRLRGWEIDAVEFKTEGVWQQLRPPKACFYDAGNGLRGLCL